MLQRKTRLRPVSLKKQSERDAYSLEARQFIAEARKEKRYCPIALELWEIKLLPRDVHHTHGRGPYLRAKHTWLAVSRRGHDWIHANMREARKRGWYYDT